MQPYALNCADWVGPYSVVWECELDNPGALIRKLKVFLNEGC